jgi:hypothetical protein
MKQGLGVDWQVDELLARVEPADLLHISSGQVSSRVPTSA